MKLISKLYKYYGLVAIVSFRYTKISLNIIMIHS